MRVTGPAPLQQCPSLLVRVPWGRRGQARGNVWGTVHMGTPGGVRWAPGHMGPDSEQQFWGRGTHVLVNPRGQDCARFETGTLSLA